VWIQSRLYPVKNEKGDVTRVIDFEEDITARKQAEEELREYQDRLRALASELTIAEERERRRIAADLHDQVGQTLALSVLQLAAVERSTTDATLRDTIEGTSQSIQQAIQDTRHLIFDLSSPAMNEIGLAAAISEWLEDQVGERYGIQTRFEDCDHRLPLTDDVRAMLFRNVRELLTNTIKHAQATHVSVTVEDTGTDVRITVNDDGVGFDAQAVDRASHEEGGFGLFSIQERMRDLGGSLEIASEPGKGCTAILTAPIRPQ
jgi:signal transduction histidine kinase